MDRNFEFEPILEHMHGINIIVRQRLRRALLADNARVQVREILDTATDAQIDADVRERLEEVYRNNWGH